MEININKTLKCPNCGGDSFELIREATYIYTYEIDTLGKEPWLNETDAFPFLFNNRKQINEKENLRCKNCSASFPCSLNKNNSEMKLVILQKALRSDFQDTPQFLG